MNNNTNDDEKSPDTADSNLRLAIFVSVIMGLLNLIGTAYLYFHVYRPSDGVPISPENHSTLLDVLNILIFKIIPITALGYFCVGYNVWKFLRKRRK